jgi:class 3 adenylate cyclase
MQGDSFHYAFAEATAAVLAAADAQSALAEHAWESEPIRVRIGIHTGTPLVTGHLYAGLDVHRAARVMSAGHGGQSFRLPGRAARRCGNCNQLRRAAPSGDKPVSAFVRASGSNEGNGAARPEIRVCPLTRARDEHRRPAMCTREPSWQDASPGMAPHTLAKRRSRRRRAGSVATSATLVVAAAAQNDRHRRDGP